MSKTKLTVALGSLLPVLACSVFLLASQAMTAPVQASEEGCEPGICMKNGCTEGSQYCNQDGKGWTACGSC